MHVSTLVKGECSLRKKKSFEITTFGGQFCGFLSPLFRDVYCQFRVLVPAHYQRQFSVL